MSCINDEIIQKFIDGEADKEEVSMIEKHRAECMECDARITHRKKVAQALKNAMNTMANENADIPVMQIPVTPAIRSHSWKRNVLVSVAAACLILMVIIFSIDRGNDPEQQELTVTDWEYNANMPISQQDLVIKVSDADGKVVEFIID